MAAGAVLVEIAAVVTVVLQVFSNGSYEYGSYLAVDSLGAIVLLTVGMVGTAAAFYSIGYLREEVRKQIIGFSRVRQFFILFHLFLTAMFFAIITLSPIGMWIAIEATTLSTAFLISFYGKSSSMEAAWKYLIINSIGLLLGFLGTLLFLTASESGMSRFIDWDALVADAGSMNPMLAKIAFIFVLIGYGTKVGLAPMHTWLPDAHSKAPSPISAMLSGSLLNVAMLAILKFKMVTDAAVPHSYSRNLLIFFGVISITIPAFIVIVQKNYKRLFAYSSIEHMGIIALGFGFGGLGAFGALLHMIYHSLAKSVLFFSAGNILLKFGSTKIIRIRGVLSALPVNGSDPDHRLPGDNRHAAFRHLHQRVLYPHSRYCRERSGRDRGAVPAAAYVRGISQAYLRHDLKQRGFAVAARGVKLPDTSARVRFAGCLHRRRLLPAGTDQDPDHSRGRNGQRVMP